MKTIYLVFETEGSYDDYQETMLQAFLSEAKADNYRAELAVKIEAHNSVAAEITKRIKAWITSNPRPDSLGFGIVNQPLRDWHTAYGRARTSINPNSLYSKYTEYVVRETELDDEE